MQNKKLIFRNLLSILLFLGLMSCSNTSDDIGTDTKESINSAYILNTGPNNTDGASLTYYDLSSKVIQYSVFQSMNGIKTGDTAQDMVIYGSKMYITVYSSGVIYVTDKNAKLLATIKDDNQKLLPREVEAYGGKIYVTLYDGYLARIDTTTMRIDRRIAVGPNPEGLEIVNNKVYVANSGGSNWNNGYNNTLSIVDTALLTRRDIDVGINPNEIESDQYNNLYLVSRGNYKDIPSSLQLINTSTDQVTILDQGRAFSIFPYYDRLYILDKKHTNGKPKSSFIYYDIPRKKIVETPFIADDLSALDINLLAIEPISRDYYIGTSNGLNNGMIYIFSANGKFKSKFDSGGPYPEGVHFFEK
ncbi:MAG: hypothetical protein RL662_1609 [Bacteroidota bacterium]|jgi:hypothetical protein